MKPQELRNSILSKAFSGGLVESINVEFDFLFQEVVFEENEPFEIPDSWKWSTLGLCCEMYTGNSIPEAVKKAKYTGLKTGYDYIGTKDVSFDQVITYDNGVRIPKEDGFKIAYKGSVLMCIEGGSAGRKIAILDRDVCFGNKLCMFNPSFISNKYLYYYMQSPELRSLFKESMTGIIGGVSIKKLKDLPIPLPPLSEQKRIVAKIEELLPYVDRYEEAWKRLGELDKRFPGDLQKSVLQLAIQGKLVEQRPDEGTAEELYREIQREKQQLVKEGKIKKEKPLPEIKEDEIPFEIPDGWMWVRFASICEVINGDRGKNYPAKSSLSHEGIPFISALNLNGTTVINDDNLLCLSHEQYNKLNNGKTIRGDIIVCIRGSLGKHGRYPFEKGAIASSLVIVRPFLHDEETYNFIMKYLDSPLFFSEIKRFDNGTAQPNLAAKSFEQFIFPLPPLSEQKRIVTKIEELLPLCERLTQINT